MRKQIQYDGTKVSASLYTMPIKIQHDGTEKRPKQAAVAHNLDLLHNAKLMACAPQLHPAYNQDVYS